MMAIETSAWQHKIATGWNAGSLTRVIDIVDTGVDFQDYFVTAMGTYAPGVLVPRGDFSVTTEGIKTLRWTMLVARPEQYNYLLNTFLDTGNGIWSGKVTIYTPTVYEYSYDTYNAMLTLAPPVAQRYDRGWWQRLEFNFSDLQVVS